MMQQTSISSHPKPPSTLSLTNKLWSPASSKPRPLRVMILGLTGVGKTALTVRYITKRFIGEYDPTLEKTYQHQAIIGQELILMDILDSAGHDSAEGDCNAHLESNIRWADTFVLMYSVTDKCSFDECNRLKFLINYNKRRKGRIQLSSTQLLPDVLVVLVGNKKDQVGDRMVSRLEGVKRSKDIGCFAFYEVSVRESFEDVNKVFEHLYREWKQNCLRMPKLKRSTSDLHHGPVNLDTFKFTATKCSSIPSPWTQARLGTSWTDRLLESRQNSLDQASTSGNSSESSGLSSGHPRFRDRASTDGSLQSTNKIPYEKVKRSLCDSPLFDRRMSISQRGSKIQHSGCLTSINNFFFGKFT
ncbi:hypothetical protein CHUAL_010590 [Chamberlinius hualienensis]